MQLPSIISSLTQIGWKKQSSLQASDPLTWPSSTLSEHGEYGRQLGHSTYLFAYQELLCGRLPSHSVDA